MALTSAEKALVLMALRDQPIPPECGCGQCQRNLAAQTLIENL